MSIVKRCCRAVLFLPWCPSVSQPHCLGFYCFCKFWLVLLFPRNCQLLLLVLLIAGLCDFCLQQSSNKWEEIARGTVLVWCPLFLLPDFPTAKNIIFFFLVKKLFSQIVKNVFDRLCQVLCLCCVLPLAKSTTLLNILVFLLFQPLNVYVCMYLSSSVFGSFPQEIVWWKEATFSVVPLHSMKIKPAAEVKHKSTFFLFASSNLKR